MANTDNHAVIEGDFSLADLANLNTDDIKALTSRLPMAGVWYVLMTGVGLTVLPAKEDKAPVPVIVHKFESVKINPLVKEADFDIESTIGRKISDRATLWSNSEAAFKEELGYVKGKYEKCGFETKGRLGGMTEQGGEPGWLDTPVLEQRVIKLRVRHGARNGQDVAYIDWIGPDDSNEEQQEQA